MELVQGTNMLVVELSQGQELALELEARLNQSSIDLCKSLVHKILASYEKAISITIASTGTASCGSFMGSLQSESSEQPFKSEHKETASKKRYAHAHDAD